ncbi:MAG: redoxin domain-containing protein [Planctomycetota bacterium]
MQMKWLAIFTALLMVACNNTATESGNTTGGDSNTQQKTAPDDDADNHDHDDDDDDGDEHSDDDDHDADEKKDEKKDDNSFEGEKVGAKSDTDDDEPETKLTVSEQFKEIKSEYDVAYKEYRSEARKAKTTAARSALSKKFTAVVNSAGERAMVLAEENLQDESAAEVLIWASRNVTDAEMRKKAMELALDHFMDSPKMSDVCMTLSRGAPSADNEATLKKLRDESPHDEVQAAATYGLANFYKGIKRSQDYAKTTDRYTAPAFVADYDIESVDMEEIYQSLVDNFGDIKAPRGTYGEIGEKALFEIRFLSIGKVAPDIEGKDFDGESFKLSDYRGKVVVIDFWGDW